MLSFRLMPGVCIVTKDFVKLCQLLLISQFSRG